MSKIIEHYSDLFNLIWLSPDGNRYMAYYRTGDFPEYLIDVGALLKYFEDFATIDLIIEVQRLIVDFVKETTRPAEIDGYLTNTIYDRIEDIAYFANVLENVVKRDTNLIEGYVEWRTQKVREL